MDIQRKQELLGFCKKVGIRFKNLQLLNQAFIHRSVTNEQKKKNNERLEFLGDSVLGLVTASYLYTTLDNPEGDLAKLKSSAVSEKALAMVGFDFGIQHLLVLGHGEEVSGGRNKPAIIADCMEAIIGAYYLDSGFKDTEKYVLSFIAPTITNILKQGIKDYKSQLQEYCQKKYKQLPVYTVSNIMGPIHNQLFYVTVKIKNRTYGPQSACSKKEAEQKVAQIALNCLKK